MDEQPNVNDVKLDADGALTYFDGTEWVPYPELPDYGEPPNAVSRGGDDG